MAQHTIDMQRGINDSGQLVLDGTAAELLGRNEVKRIFLGR